jgi:hypothetical protein
VAQSDGLIVGVAIVGRPVARMLDDGFTCEVTRVCTDGAGNACSMLYGTCWRAARALGFTRAVTYTEANESGASLRAAGWLLDAELEPRTGWGWSGRPRQDRGTDRVARLGWKAVTAGHGMRSKPRMPADVGVPEQPNLFTGTDLAVSA